MSKGNKRSSNMMKRGQTMEQLPNELIIQIFSRLRGKSVARFRCLSKQWGSMLRSPGFTELFLTRSMARPRLLFAVEQDRKWLFFSSPQHQNPYDKSSLVVAAEFHTKFSDDIDRLNSSYASGLMYFPGMNPSEDKKGYSPVICNPITGQYERLPESTIYRTSRGTLGFDPIDKKFKVLTEAYPFCDERVHHLILTLKTRKLRWRRRTHCPAYNRSESDGICINGVIYYLACYSGDLKFFIVCFDLKSEEFKEFINAEFLCENEDTITTKLINYKGKLVGIDWKYATVDGRRTLELCMWVLEDVQKQEWSKHVYTLWESKIVDPCNFSVVGVTAIGEIVLSMDYTCKPFYVFFFNPEKNTLRSVEIQGFGADLEALETRGRVHTFVDYVEDLNLNDAKQLKSSISASSVKA